MTILPNICLLCSLHALILISWNNSNPISDSENYQFCNPIRIFIYTYTTCIQNKTYARSAQSPYSKAEKVTENITSPELPQA